MSPIRPMFHRLKAWIEREGKKEGYVENAGEDWFFARIANGDRLEEIAADFGCSRPFLYRWFNEKGHKERRRAKLKEARAQSAWSKVEEAEKILDTAATKPDITSAQAQIANNRAGHRRWYAGKVNREDFGDEKGVTIQIGELHLEALQAQRLKLIQPAEIPEADWEEEA